MTTLLHAEERIDSAVALAPIIAQLEAGDRVLQWEKGASSLLRAWSVVCGFVLVAFAADVVMHLAPRPRLEFDAAFGVLVLGFLVRAAWLAWIRRNSHEHTARVLEARDPALGSKLINILQLRAQTADPRLEPLTHELARHAIAGYAEELGGIDLPRLARTDCVTRAGKQALFGVLCCAAVLLVFNDITRTELARFFDPYGDHPPYSFTRLEITDPTADGAEVVYGESLVIAAKATGHRPGELFVTYFPPGQPEQSTTVPMFDKGERGFSQQIEGITSDLVVFVHTKNLHSLSKQRRIGVILTPKLTAAFVKITPPAYTALSPEQKPLEFKTVKALAGSALEFRLQSNRPLKDGRIDVIKSPDDVKPVAMTASGSNEVIGAIEATDSTRLRFSVTDRDGHASQENQELALTVTHDLPPDVQITNPTGDSFVAMDFTVDAVIEASDDYGVKTLRIHQARNDEWQEPKTTSYDLGMRNVRDGLTFDFKTMELESGDTISFFAEAIDTAPEPHIARSKTITLTVITTEEYNAFLREQIDMGDIAEKYSALIQQIAELAEAQKNLGEQSGALQNQIDSAKDEKARAALQQRLDDLLAKQNALNQKLNQLAETMDNFVRKEPLYDIESELQDVLKQKAEQIRESTAANDKSSQQIAQRNSQKGAPDQQMTSDFKQASDEQLAKLGAAEQEAQQQVVEPLEDMALLHEIMKDINRFKELYEAQRQLAEHAKAYDRAQPLSREDQLALKDLAGTEKAIGEQLDAVEQKLWEDGKAAEEKFPKAGASAQRIAEQMGDLRLQMHANNATAAMLAGHGDKGAQLAATLRDEMEKLFSECNSQGGEMSSELDQYMKISRGLNPRNSFQQMMQSKKFGSGNKPGFGMGSGPAGSGSDGFAVMTGPNANVLGNETAISRESTAAGSKGKNKAPPAGTSLELTTDKPDVVKDVNAVNRESEAVQGETTIEQYSDVVEKYFKAITK